MGMAFPDVAPAPITLDNASINEIKERAKRRIAELKRRIQNNNDDLKKLQLELDEWQGIFEPVAYQEV
jgi:hypothetical protein